MHITYKGDYALKAILELSLEYGKNLVTISELAKRIDAPEKFLEQILLDLKRAGFVESKRGKVGGYILSRPPSEIKLGEVIRFIDGPLEPVACIEKDYKDCRDVANCIFRQIWQQVYQATSSIIDSLTFEELVKRVKKEELIYYI